MKAKIKKEEKEPLYVGSQSDIIGFSNFVIDFYEQKVNEMGKEAADKWFQEDDDE